MDDNNLNKSDEDLFNQMIMQDKIFRNLQGYLQEESYITRYQQTWQKLAQQVVIAQKVQKQLHQLKMEKFQKN